MSFVVAAAATLSAVVLTIMLVRQLSRARRLDLAALTCAAAVLTVALAAQGAGALHGYSVSTFRVVYICAQLFGPLAFTWALVELVGKSVEARFTSRLGLIGVAIFGMVVLGTDPLITTSFTKAWPAAATYYQFIPTGVLLFVAVLVTASAVLGLLVAGVRARQGGQWKALLLPVLATVAAAVLTDALRVASIGTTGHVAICLAGVLLAWFAGHRASGVAMEEVRWGHEGSDDTGGFREPARPGRGYGDATAFGDSGRAGDGRAPQGRAAQGRAAQGRAPQDRTPQDRAPQGQAHAGGYARPSDTGSPESWYRDGTGLPSRGSRDAGGFAGPDTGGPDTGAWGPDTGGFGRGADTGGFSRGADTGGWRQDTGGFGRGGMDAAADWVPGEEGPARDLPPRGAVRPGDSRAEGAPPWDDEPGGGAMPVSGRVTGGGPVPGGEGDFGAWFREDANGDAGQGLDDSADWRLGSRAETNGRGGHATDGPSPPAGYAVARQSSLPDGEDDAPMYGQIAIYTLLDGSTDEFDRIARRVVEQVKAREPGTLAYVMHGVPSAPLQRILYEIYRDEAAFNEHNREPHVKEFEESYQPHVLATNVIQLGVRHGTLLTEEDVQAVHTGGFPAQRWGLGHA